ncbi:MAG: outer membrane protein assembly factor [Fibromonadaceae bacterium]|jgi:hypothetical protein|nr:outer membrane protein assembly factor [Fibromonadaceae bacterium]
MRSSFFFLLFSSVLFAQLDSLFEFERFLVLPVGAYTEETGIIIGAGAMIFIEPPAEDGSKTGSNNSSVIMTSLKEQATFINKHVYEPVNGSWNFVSHLYLTNWPTQFFEIGNEWDKEEYDVFTSKNIRLDITLGRDLFLKSKFSYGIELDAEYITFNYDNVGKTELQYFTDLKNSGRLGLGYNLTYNSSERNDWPRKGSFVQIRHIYFGAEDNNAKRTFIWKNIDTKMYIPLFFLPEGVLALSSYLEDFDGEVPFDRLAQPDGVGQLRGLKKGFLADKTSWVLQSELRTHLFWRCKGTMFYELGKVGSGFKELNANEWHESIGIGGRFLVNRKSKTHIRGDLALIDKKYLGMAIKINEAF